MSAEIAVVKPSLGEIAFLAPEKIGVWATFNLSTEAGIKAAYNARIAPDFRVEEVLGSEIEVEHVVVHSAVKVDDESGEEVALARVILVSPDGSTYACASKGLLRDLADLMAIRGNPPWHPPVKVIPTQVPTRRGYRTFRLKLA